MNTNPSDNARVSYLRRQAVANFRRSMRLRALLLWVIVMGVGTVCCITGQRYFTRGIGEERLLYAIIYFLSIQVGILFSLWYWLSPRVMLLLKEVKLIRVDLARDSGEGAAGASESLVDLLKGRPFNRWLVLGVSLATILLVSAAATWFMPPIVDVVSAYARLSDDGAADIFTELKGTYTGQFPTSELHDNSDKDMYDIQPDGGTLRYPGKRWDGAGHDLPVEVRLDPTGTAYLFTTQFPAPIYPGDRIVMRDHVQVPHFLKKDGDAWRVRIQTTDGDIHRQYRYVIELPKGAQLLDPKPGGASTCNGVTTVTYVGGYRPGSPVRCEFTYRLPAVEPQAPNPKP